MNDFKINLSSQNYSVGIRDDDFHSHVKVLTFENGATFGDCPNQLRRDFFEAYVDDDKMRKVLARSEIIRFDIQ
jgi:hypothetical protein